MRIVISTYWKCQLIGWGLFTIVTYLALVIGYPNGTDFFSRALVTCSFGLLFTHFIRWVIKRLSVFKKKLVSQVIYLLLITIIITLIANLIYVTVLRTFFYLYYQELMVAFGWVAIYFLVHYIRSVRVAEREKAEMRIKLVESEAQALRAQMNPHFVFNSMNSIKSLINKNENDAAANYLTTFSKLIRTLFQNSDKREVSLYEELETCKLYTQLEAMRFGNKVQFIFNIDETIDLKDFKVPALILQPFIENAIWHGLIPSETGGMVTISVGKSHGGIQCSIDDNGIGRKRSRQYKPQYEANYQSKGIGLTQSRLELDKLLNEREGSISIIDKENGSGEPEGTKIVITFKEN
jgi:LytS/YehU family sensor histidine kinase